MSTHLYALYDCLAPARFPLSGEKPLQEAIEAHLIESGLAFEREVTLGPGDIVDFMVGTVAVEVKIKGQRRAIYRQCERYAGHDSVSAILLVTNVAMGFPPSLKGKPTAVLNLGRAWL
ncbi:hypothetical protein NVS89_22590 [Ancylobacter sp. MQZ15Z-1]|uniref:Uncharacterized protein n=1 Tax=Ancylobacter mangrovi TaxID=2972472 RepID=A0A9X2PKB7_9HYPH|nr:hypothetical protein [Ancylobacter mangrovi]MCS0497883.1 hypothetical protein [Ancylobacter mangrovi]